MPYLIYNGKMIDSGGKYVVGTLAIQGVLDFAGTYYVTVDASLGNLDLSGTKTVRWKMWLDSSTATGNLFHLGLNANNMFSRIASGSIWAGNFNGPNGTNGDAKIIPLTDAMTGYTLDCIAVKNSTQLLWFQIGGFGAPGKNAHTSGSPPQNYSRIGANGNPDTDFSPANGVYVWDVTVEGESAWSGYGSAPNTDVAWVDTIGSNDGTVLAGSPTIKVLTEPTPTYTDWYMPSKDEVAAMYNNLYVDASNLTHFYDIPYWTSSEFNSTDAWAHAFANNLQINIAKNYLGSNVRAARTFVGSPGDYSLKDVGPAGGWIFHIADGSTQYYECAPYDNMGNTTQGTPGNAWSNVTTGLTDASGTGFGDGAINTALITSQIGHEYSCADICEKYVVI